MNRIDKNLKSDLESGSSDKRDWLANHTLSQEQVRQLIHNKYERAKKDHLRLKELKKLIQFSD